MTKITLDDILHEPPEEIIKKVGDASEEQPPGQKDAPLAEKKIKLKVNRKAYTNLFPPDFVFEKGQKHQLSDHYLEVLSVEKGSGRVRFLKSDTQEIFSLSISVLTGSSPDLLYQVGDKVLFENREAIVKGLNPASMNVVIEVGGKTRYVKLSKVSSCVKTS